MMALRETDPMERNIAEQLAFESGRPILIFPGDSEREAAKSFDYVAVAWDLSRPSTRAIADALPLLEQAKQAGVHGYRRQTDRKIELWGEVGAISR